MWGGVQPHYTCSRQPITAPYIRRWYPSPIWHIVPWAITSLPWIIDLQICDGWDPNSAFIILEAGKYTSLISLHLESWVLLDWRTRRARLKDMELYIGNLTMKCKRHSRRLRPPTRLESVISLRSRLAGLLVGAPPGHQKWQRRPFDPGIGWCGQEISLSGFY